MLPIRAILFDADGVLQHSRGDDLSARLERILGSAPANIDVFAREVFEAERPAAIGQADFAEQLLPLVAPWGGRGVPDKDIADKLAAEWWCSIEVDEPLLALVGSLRQHGWLCVLASNQQRYRARYMAEALGYAALFDRCFYSYEVGALKTEARYFEAVVAQLGLSPQQLLFIDDAEKNVAVARSAGLHAASFVHPRNGSSREAMLALLAQFSVHLPG